MIVRMTLLGLVLTASAALGLGLTDATGQAAPAVAAPPPAVATAQAPRPVVVAAVAGVEAARPSLTCERQTWPYVAPECLTQGSAPVRKVSRILK